jgi:hypothetical protein
MPGYTLSQFSIFDKFRDFIIWSSLDGYVVGGDAGYAAEPYGAYVYLATANGAPNDIAYLYSGYPPYGWVNLIETGKVVTVEFLINWLDSIVNQHIYLCSFGNPFYPPTSEAADHFGWKIIGADLYATNADDTAETITDTGVNLVTGYQRTRLKMVFDPGHNIKFYVNDVLKATHTTNLPGTAGYTTYSLLFYIVTLNGISKGADLGRVLLEREN